MAEQIATATEKRGRRGPRRAPPRRRHLDDLLNLQGSTCALRRLTGCHDGSRVDLAAKGGAETGASVDVDLSFDNDLGVDLSGIPSSFSLDLTHIPKIQVGVDKLSVGLDPIKIEPLDVSVRIKEIPNIRTHVPAFFTIGLSVLGYELLCAKLCGEAQVITEPYVPNPCEHCGHVSRTPTPVPATQPEVPK